MNLNLLAECLGLAAGLSLAWPAVRLNSRLRTSISLRSRAEARRSSRVRDLFRAAARAAQSNEWSATDHILTLAGVALLIASSGIKVYLELLSPQQ